MSFLFAPAAGRGTLPPSADGESPAEVQRKTPPVRGEPANAVRVPRSAGAEKGAARQGEHAHVVRVPRSAGAKIKLNCFSDNATAKRHTQAETA